MSRIKGLLAHRLFAVFFIFCLICLVFFPILQKKNIVYQHFYELEPQLQQVIRDQLDQQVSKTDHLWTDFEFQYKKDHYHVELSIDHQWQEYLHQLILQYQSDYTAIVILENESGKILAALDHEKARNQFGKKVVFSSTSPAASLVKVITAAELMEEALLDPMDQFNYTGKPYTLYKHQLEEKKHNRWTRSLTFKRAFEMSNNVIFGKAAQLHTTERGLLSAAQKFGFNSEIISELSAGKSYFPLPKDRYNLAELASGLNRVTLMSPAHAAKIAMIMANHGEKFSLSIVNSVKKNGKLFYENNGPKNRQRVVSEKSALKIRDLMEGVIQSGTARALSRQINAKIRNELKIGSKSGSMTGGLPYGKRDWLISYIQPKEMNSMGISLAVMIVNKDKWYTKSSFLTQNIVKHYYKQLMTDQVQTQMAASQKEE